MPIAMLASQQKLSSVPALCASMRSRRNSLSISGNCFAFNCPNISCAGPDTFLCAFRGAPLPSIAQWISGLFGNVDLAPSDITAALVLAAAAQRRRRKNRIKKALNPIMQAASNAATSTTTDQVSDLDTASMDEREWLLTVLACCSHACFSMWLAVGSTCMLFASLVFNISCILAFCGCVCRHSAAHNASSNLALHFVLLMQWPWFSGRPCLPPHAMFYNLPHVICSTVMHDWCLTALLEACKCCQAMSCSTHSY